jgi:hypothetical protein
MTTINCIIKKIIKEDECKKFKLGFNPVFNTDYLLLEESEYNFTSKKKKYKLFKILTALTLLPSLFFLFAVFSFKLSLPFYIIGTILMLSFLVFFNLSYPKAKNIQIRQLIPAEKPNNFKVGEEVELNIFVNKI